MKYLFVSTIVFLSLLSIPRQARAQHNAMHHEMDSAAPPSAPMMNGMMDDPLHAAMMDVLAVPALSEQLSVSPLQIETINGLLAPLLDAARSIPSLSASGSAPSVEDVRTILKERGDVIVQAYSASLRIKELLSGSQRQSYAEMDLGTIHGAVMSAEGHDLLMPLLGGCSGMPMGGMMHGDMGMMHGDPKTQNSEHPTAHGPGHQQP